MEYAVVSIVALLASGLTLFSGCGLGTLLLPAFLLFFPTELAIAMTAIVHFLNNIFKLTLLGKHANLSVVLRFGIPAVIAAFAGAALLFLLTDQQPLASYVLNGRTFFITPIKLIMGMLIAAFSVFEALPALRQVEFDRKFLPVGGLLSGFFGGVSGHQGALRSAFLVRAGLSKESFIATGVVIACLIDVTRMSVYANHLSVTGLKENVSLLAIAVVSAFAGVFFGSRVLAKVTMNKLQMVVTIMLFVIALLLGLGLV